MENQYCKVGAVKPLNNEEQSVLLLEYLYQNFIDKSSNIQYANTKLGEFFESKAQKFEKLLKEL
tara:strand:+ start:5914 stop:6105 length:192 start_codon:yes stop_codon:yes gene_type:complete